MRKYNEGYVLPLVLVVLVVLCTVSLSVMAPAVSNLKVQEASIERMQDRYEALGKAKEDVNCLISDIQRCTASNVPLDGGPYTSGESTVLPEILEAIKSSIEGQLNLGEIVLARVADSSTCSVSYTSSDWHRSDSPSSSSSFIVKTQLSILFLVDFSYEGTIVSTQPDPNDENTAEGVQTPNDAGQDGNSEATDNPEASTRYSYTFSYSVKKDENGEHEISYSPHYTITEKGQ